MASYAIRVALPGKVLPPSHTRGRISLGPVPARIQRTATERVLAGMDIRAEQVYNEYLERVENRRRRLQRGWTLAKQATWLSLLVGGYLMMFLVDVAAETFELLGIGF